MDRLGNKILLRFGFSTTPSYSPRTYTKIQSHAHTDCNTGNQRIHFVWFLRKGRKNRKWPKIYKLRFVYSHARQKFNTNYVIHRYLTRIKYIVHSHYLNRRKLLIVLAFLRKPIRGSWKRVIVKSSIYEQIQRKLIKCKHLYKHERDWTRSGTLGD